MAAFSRTLFYAAWATFVPPAAADNTVTPDKWMMAWQGPPRQTMRLSAGRPFVPAEATRDNTVTPDKWFNDFDRMPRVWPNWKTHHLFVPKAATVENTVPGGWWQPLSAAKPKPPVFTQPLYVTVAYAPDNTVTIDKWLMRFDPAPRYRPPKILAQPFVPRGAVLENTVDQGWRVAFTPAAPTPKPRTTQPFFGYPYESASNLTTSIEWLTQWRGPPRYWWAGRPYQPFVPSQAVLDNTITGIAWMQGWKGPPRYRPPKLIAQPFTPREATVQNTITGISWLQRFNRAAPYRLPWHTQPFFAYPYEQLAPQFLQDVLATLHLSVDIHICGWGTVTEQTDGFSVESEQGQVWTVQDESDDDYDEQDECGR